MVLCRSATVNSITYAKGRSMKLAARLFAFVMLIMLVFVGLLPVSAAASTSAIDSVLFDTASCILTVTWTAGSEGSSLLQIWDDGSMIGSSAALTAQTSTYQLYIPSAVVDDIGIYVVDFDTSFQFDSIDPYVIDTSNCLPPSSPSACISALPADTAIYTVPAGAPTFYAPSADTQLGFSLPAGTWYITEFDGDFAHVFIACGANLVWIPADSVQR